MLGPCWPPARASCSCGRRPTARRAARAFPDATRSGVAREGRGGGRGQRVRVAVVGGAGFIGSNLVDALVDRGDEVVVVDNFSTGRRSNVHQAANLAEL